jgi:HEAT repeat protein
MKTMLWIVLACVALPIQSCQQARRPTAQPGAASPPRTEVRASPPEEDPNSALIERLSSADEMDRYLAAADAGKLAKGESSAGLSSALTEMLRSSAEKPGTREWAARALARLAPQDALVLFPELQAVGIAVSYDAWIEVGPAALPYLRKQAEDPSRALAAFAAVSEVIRDHPVHPESIKTIPLLLHAIEDDSKPRALALRAMGFLGPPLVKELTALLEAPEPALRRRAAMALGLIGPGAASAVDALASRSSDSDRSVRDAAAGALKRIRK